MMERWRGEERRGEEKPTRIIMPPRIVKLGKRGAATTMILTCDNGEEYGIQELAKIVGFAHSHGLYQRLRSHGWDNADILKPPSRKGYRIDGGGSGACAEKGELSRLSNRSRSENLKKIPAAGIWERRL